jgi:hypothetical protein
VQLDIRYSVLFEPVVGLASIVVHLLESWEHILELLGNVVMAESVFLSTEEVNLGSCGLCITEVH